jgi:putative transcriptional regulator
MNLKMRLARTKKNLSQAKLADLVGVTRQTILLIEKDSFNPSIQLCISIAKALDTTLDGLFWNKEQRIHEESHHDS